MTRAATSTAKRHTVSDETPQHLVIAYWGRLGRKVTMEELAKICAIARPTLTNVLLGRTRPSDAFADRLAAVLGVTRARLDAALTRAQLNRSGQCPPFAT
jgi:hypothetical protein